jgi:hypothetical protein
VYKQRPHQMHYCTTGQARPGQTRRKEILTGVAWWHNILRTTDTASSYRWFAMQLSDCSVVSDGGISWGGGILGIAVHCAPTQRLCYWQRASACCYQGRGKLEGPACKLQRPAAATPRQNNGRRIKGFSFTNEPVTTHHSPQPACCLHLPRRPR